MKHKGGLVIFGSLAYDDIYSYEGSLREHLPEEKLTPLYVNIRASGPKTRRGGCGGNVAWTAAQFPIPISLVSWVGGDGGEYIAFLNSQGVKTEYIEQLQSESTPRAILLSDILQDQFLIFSTQEAVHTKSPFFEGGFTFAVVTAGIPQQTKEIVRAVSQKKIPFIIDPGKLIQDIPDDDLLFCISGADSLVVNYYEKELLIRKTGKNWDYITDLVDSTIVTQGEKGSYVLTVRGKSRIPAVLPKKIGDPYGAGDAFLAGFSIGRINGYSHEWSARFGAVAASFTVEKEGAQENPFSLQEFSGRLYKTFGSPDIPLSKTFCLEEQNEKTID